MLAHAADSPLRKIIDANKKVLREKLAFSEIDGRAVKKTTINVVGELVELSRALNGTPVQPSHILKYKELQAAICLQRPHLSPGNKNDLGRAEAVVKSMAPPDFDPNADVALALCDAYIFARIGSWNMRAAAPLAWETRRLFKMASLAKLAFRERWTVAALQELPANINSVVEAARGNLFFRDWEFLGAHVGPDFQTGSKDASIIFAFDRSVWNLVEKADARQPLLMPKSEAAVLAAAPAASAAAAASVAIATMPESNILGESGQAGAADEANGNDEERPQEAENDADASDGGGNGTVDDLSTSLVRNPALLFLRSIAFPSQVLALVSVHSAPSLHDARREARALGLRLAQWVDECKNEWGIPDVITVLIGDHNLSAPDRPGQNPSPAGAWSSLLSRFQPIPFLPNTSTVTNIPELLGKNLQTRKHYDHAFIMDPERVQVDYSARVVDITSRQYSSAAADYVALQAAIGIQIDNKAVKDLRDEFIEKLRKSVWKDFVCRDFSDHKPITVCLRSGRGGGHRLVL
jgi:hypothetical protein